MLLDRKKLIRTSGQIPDLREIIKKVVRIIRHNKKWFELRRVWSLILHSGLDEIILIDEMEVWINWILDTDQN